MDSLAVVHCPGEPVPLGLQSGASPPVLCAHAHVNPGGPRSTLCDVGSPPMPSTPLPAPHLKIYSFMGPTVSLFQPSTVGRRHVKEGSIAS